MGNGESTTVDKDIQFEIPPAELGFQTNLKYKGFESGSTLQTR